MKIPDTKKPDMKKPELGLTPCLTPYSIWLEQIKNKHIEERLEDIKQTITSYMQNNKEINEHWLEEYNEIIKTKE